MANKGKSSWHKCMLCDCEFFGEGRAYLDYCPSCKVSTYPKTPKKPIKTGKER